MLALLSILFGLALLGLTVYGLHKYQTMEVEFTVDRSAPLPPLDRNSVTSSLSPEPDAISSPVATSAQPATRKTSTQQARPKTWQEQVAHLKSAGQLTEAAALCRQHLPLWGAYNQLCMLIRSELKNTQVPAAEREEHLQRLYNTATIAEFLHDKSKDADKLTHNQLRELNMQEVSALDFPYAVIGYAHLRLIRKSDIKCMIEFWGRPDTHISPREHHANWWQKQRKS